MFCFVRRQRFFTLFKTRQIQTSGFFVPHFGRASLYCHVQRNKFRMVQRLYLQNSISFYYVLILNKSYVLVREYYFKGRQTPLSKGSEGSQPLTRTAASKHALSRGRCGRPGAGTVQRHTDIGSSVYT